MSNTPHAKPDRDLRLASLDSFKKSIRIGIFGSFYNSRKDDLLQLRDYLRNSGYTQARISEDLDERSKDERQIDNPIINRDLSIQLINESDIHIFILCMRKESEPPNLIQSVSMELERIFTLRETGNLNANYVGVYIEKPLRDTGGGVFRGLVMTMENDWVIEDFDDIQDIFKPVMFFCLDSIRDIHNF